MSVAWLQKTAKGFVPPRTFENQDPYPESGQRPTRVWIALVRSC